MRSWIRLLPAPDTDGAVITISAILTAIMTLRTPQKRRGRCNYTGPAFSAIGNASAETRYGGAVDINRAADLYAQGRTVRQIGAELGVTGTTVSDQLRRAGVTLRRGGAPAHRASTQQILELRDQGLTWPEMAEQVGITVSGAWSRYRRARPPKSPRLGRWQQVLADALDQNLAIGVRAAVADISAAFELVTASSTPWFGTQ